ncbi:MAG: hypothetical protein NTX44_04030 [Ignavibacteriales bacterium]|nr:hypothetical protein [Ignavibacteriales bacterium]
MKKYKKEQQQTTERLMTLRSLLYELILLGVQQFYIILQHFSTSPKLRIAA